MITKSAASTVLDTILPRWRAGLPSDAHRRYLDGFVVRLRPQLEDLIGDWLRRREVLAPDAATKASRTRNNLEAMRIVATRRPQDMSADERRAVLAYSGWGGLSIEAVMDQFPPGMVPSEFALIHEYYTPTRVAEAIADLVCPLLADLAGFDGIVRAFEPSVGIGRLIRAMGPPRCLVTDPRYKETRWTAVELSDVSARMFGAMRPDVELFSMSLERWMSEHAPRYQGTLHVVLANPPYGERGEFGLQDKHPDYQERTAYAYFMRRCLDLLVPNGLGVFVIPAGFLTGSQNQKLRQRVLLRHHLEVAFRLPSESSTGKDLFPGAGNVVDVLVWRARGGELREIDPGDATILAGEYFKEQPDHILGTEVHHDVGAAGPAGKKRRRYAVVGDFDGFPTRPPVAAPIERREFLRLGLGGAALIVGCGDDPGEAAGDTSSSDTSTGGSDPTGAAPTGTGEPTTTAATSTGDSSGTTTDPGTGEPTTSSTSTGEASTGDASTGEPAVCAGQAIAFEPAAISLDAALFPTAVMAGEMRPTSVMLAVFIAEPGARTLRVWRTGEVAGEVELVHEAQVEPGVDGFLKVVVDGLCPGTWYSYGLFVGAPDGFTARSLIGEFRTAIADDVLEPLTLALGSCNGASLVWPSMTVTADEYYDMFIHLGDMAYNDGATSLAEFRASWRKYLGADGYKQAFARAGLYATWDDHEIDNNSNFDRETMDPQQLAKRQNAFDAFFEALPIDAQGPDYQLWRSFRWGLTAEIIVLDCRYERRPSMQQYISPAQMAFLKQRLLESPCHFKVVMNSVPITNMPLPWDIAADDRWEGYPGQRQELLAHIDQHDIRNVWFLSGDFHVCFVSRLEPAGQQLSARTREIAVTSGNTNPIPEFLTQLDPPQFAYGVHQPRGVLVTFDPRADNVLVRFLDPQTGEELYAETLTQS